MVKAVLAVGAEDVRDAVARAQAVTAVRGSDDFAAVSAAFKRMKNILTQAAEKGIASGNERRSTRCFTRRQRRRWRSDLRSWQQR